MSSRARRLSLRVESGQGVIVTIPRGFSPQRVPAFIARHRQWIEARLAEAAQRTPERFRQWPPEQLALPAVDLVLELSYAARSDRDARHAAAPTAGNLGRTRQLRVKADSADRAAVVGELRLALKALARQYFCVRLEMLAERHGLTYQRIQIRGQRTRWGSCSSTGTISLNYKLLFLSPELVDYVLLHELAHTRHLNHSPAFWRQLITMLPDARQRDAMLDQAGREVPPWMELKAG